MTCGACSATVERALSVHIGVHEAAVSCITNLARVEFDPTAAAPARLVEAVEDVGFEAVLVEIQEIHAQGGPGQPQPPLLSVELHLKGMTCSACSGTIERLLQSTPGVKLATVSLILNKAFIVCDGTLVSSERLQEEVESIGFDAHILAVGPAEALAAGRASLHVQVVAGSGLGPLGTLGDCKDHCDDFEARARGLPGVLGCQTMAEGYKRILYDPIKIGARRLLDQVHEVADLDFQVEWVHVNAENEQLQGFVREMCSFRRDVRLAVPPAALVLSLTIILPSIGLNPHDMGILSCPVHHGVDVLVLVILAICTPVQFVVGRRFHRAAYKALRRKSPNMDVLVSIATNTAYFYSLGLILFCLVMPETPGSHNLVLATSHFFTMGPILIAVVLVGKFLEARAKLTAMEAMTDLPSSIPAEAVLCGEAGGGDRTIPLEWVELHDVLRIFAGSKIPVDGQVCSETAMYVDESLLTGESAPVRKKPGDLVLGGSTCISGGCLMRVTRVGCDTMLGQMVALVQEAQASKANVQRMADKVARIFVPSVVCLSFATFLVWTVLVFVVGVDVPMAHDVLHLPHGKGLRDDSIQDHHAMQDSLKLLFAMKFGMAVLMMACPCAMGLATPMAVMVATGVAARRGCLVKSAAALETSARLDAIVLDKTGTITKGMPLIQAAACVAEPLEGLLERWYAQLPGSGTLQAAGPGGRQAACNVDFNGVPALQFIGSRSPVRAAEVESCFWWLLGVLESASDHPVAKCVLAMVQQIRGLPPILAPSDFEYFSGRGVRCTVNQLGGVVARVGNLRFYEEVALRGQESPAAAELLQWVSVLQEQGHTVVVMHVDAQLVGAVALRDPIRDDAAWVVDFMSKRLGLEVWLCTGDNVATAQSIAREVGIRHVVAEALPTTKGECVQQLQRKGVGRKRRVCFVGDGINDSIALAQADVGIAIGVGAQVAVEAADVTLVRSDLADCITFLSLSKATFSTIILNFFWAFCFNFVCLPMAAGVFYPSIHIPPMAAGIGMASSSSLVVLTSLSLRWFGPPTPPAASRQPKNIEMLPLTSLTDPEPQTLGSMAVSP